ncbi:MAG TPA: hypothetical protein VE975_03580 [Actinomycetota bacterium]|nr:hypothetical protein [Actinomycetota bacterium]
MTAQEIALSFLQLAAALAVGWAFNVVVVERWGYRGPGRAGAERALFAVAGFVVFSCLLEALNIASSGAVFGSAAPVPVAATATVGAAVVRRRRLGRLAEEEASGENRPVAWAKVAAAGATVAALYLVPPLVGGSFLRTGDIPWHMGWTNQVLGGEPVPAGPAPVFARNAYPWGFHAVLAALARMVPGGNIISALAAADYLIVVGLTTGAVCLARLIDRRAGWAAAALTSLVGGFGWIEAGAPVFFTSPDRATYGADLTTASPNSVYQLFPPPLPRELGLVMAAATAALLVVAVRLWAENPAPRKAMGPAVLSGALLGVTGLVSIPSALVAGVWALLGVAAVTRARWSFLACLNVPAALVLSVWGLPVAVGFMRYGGFVDISPALGREWPLATSLASWGLLGPFALAGAILAFRDRRARLLLAFLVAMVALLALAFARDVFDWTLLGIPSLLHQGRMWPPAHLLASAFGGFALYRGYRWLSGRNRRLAVAGTAVVFAAGSISPVLASIALERIIAGHEHGYVFTGRDYAPGGFVRRAAAHLGPDDVVLAQGSNLLGFLLFQYSGARVARYDDTRLARNDLRIRYARLASAWDARMVHGGFRADYIARPRSGVDDARVVASGTYRGEIYVLLKR